MKKSRALFALLLALTLTLALLPVAHAQSDAVVDPIDTETWQGHGQLIVQGEPGMKFSIYLVAGLEVGEDGKPRYPLEASLHSWADSIDLDHRTQEGWRDLALTLRYYLKDVTPTAEQTVAENSMAVFEDLRLGLYLVVGSQFDKELEGERVTYTVDPFLITVPTLVSNGGMEQDQSSIDGSWQYHVATYPKHSRKLSETPRPLVVQKSWASGSTPVPIRVTLKWYDARSGEEKSETVTLDATQGSEWIHIWKNFYANDEIISVTEEVPAGYSVRITRMEKNGVLYIVLTNTPDDDDEPDDPEPPIVNPPVDIPDDEPPLSEPDVPDEPDEFFELPDDEVPLAELPQTGVLWWPVPILVAAGLAMMLTGAVLRRRMEVEEDDA